MLTESKSGGEHSARGSSPALSTDVMTTETANPVEGVVALPRINGTQAIPMTSGIPQNVTWIPIAPARFPPEECAVVVDASFYRTIKSAGNLLQIVVGVLLVSLLMNQASAQEQAINRNGQAEMATVRQISQQIQKNNEVFLHSDSFYVRYHISQSEQLAATKYGHPDGGYQFELGRKDGMLYTRVSEQGKDERTIILRNSEIAERFGSKVVISRTGSGHLYAWWKYTDNMYINIYEALKDIGPTHVKSPQFNQPFLPEILEQFHDSYNILGAMEKINGRECIVLNRPGVDKMWLAPSLGYALCRRELYWAGRGKDPLLQKVNENLDFQLQPDGIWLPQKQTVEIYADPNIEDEAYWGKATNRLAYLVDEIAFNHLSDSFFSMQLLSGDNVSNLINDK